MQILIDWFRFEINEVKKDKRDIMTVYALKKIEVELNSIADIEKYEEIYNKFLEIAR